MTKQEFSNLVKGDRVSFRSREYSIVEIERWCISPGKYETDSITVNGGNRMKINDADVRDLELIHN